MNNPESNHKALFAKWALALFIVGILGAILIAALGPREKDEAMQLALAFFGISEVLALVFGIIGWRHWPGKVAIFGGLGIMIFVGWMFFAPSGPPRPMNQPGPATNMAPEDSRPAGTMPPANAPDADLGKAGTNKPSGTGQ